MRIHIKNGVFYINLPHNLYSDLLELNTLHDNLNLDLAALILHFIKKQQSKPLQWVKLYSKIMQGYNYGGHKYNEQIELLKEGGLIEYLQHQNNINGRENSSRKFRISKKYFTSVLEENLPEKSIQSHEIRQYPLIKKIEKHHKKRKIEARSSTNHLTKWLDNKHFTIQAPDAFIFILEKYNKDSFKYLKRFEHIHNFKPSESYSRNGRGNRLDSIFTLLAKDLKPFVRYGSQKLVEVDIKSSQPVMFAILLQKFLDHYIDLLNSCYGVTEKRFKNRIFKTLSDYINNDNKDYYNHDKYTIDIEKISYNITIILLKTLTTPNFTQISDFISLVKGGRVYESLGSFLISEGAMWERNGKYYSLLWHERKKQTETCFESERECAKTVLLNALYSRKGKGSVTVINKVKEHFSEVFQIADAFKAVEYEDFSLILQRMEAKFVLDFCSRNIYQKYPEMLLISRHDSLSTTEEYGHILYKEFQKQVYDYFGEKLILDMEMW